MGNIVLPRPVLHLHLDFDINIQTALNDVDLMTLEDVPGAALSAAGPATLGHPELVAAGQHAAVSGLRGKVSPEHGNCGVNHEGDQEDKHGERAEEKCERGGSQVKS